MKKVCWALVIGLLSPALLSAQLKTLFRPVPPPAAARQMRMLIAVQTARGEMTGFDGGSPDSGKLQVRIDTLKSRADGVRIWEWRPVVSIPAIKLTESTRPNASVDGTVLTSVGGGVSLEHLKWNSRHGEQGGWESTFAFSPLTVLVSGKSEANVQLDVSPAMTVGLWQNKFLLGAGYDLGEVKGRSRWFGLLSIGISFIN